jgi:GPH family glycoside/pentoside/hexuronide:cation symporter
MPERMSGGRLLAYALGACGWQITDRIVVAICIYYYLPPGDTDLVQQLPDGVFLGVLTAYGLARLIGGLVDSLADPLVGWASDRSRSRLGRRRVFLVGGVAPMVGAPVLLFWPPGEPGSALTFAALVVLLALYYAAFTVYVGPYLALIPEIAWSEDERVRLSALLGIVSFPALALYGAAWPAGVALGRALGLSGEEAVRGVVLISSAVALLLCLAPIAAVDEPRFARSVRSDLSMVRALAETLRNRPFLIYLAAQILFILGVNLLGPTVPYLAIVLLGRDEAFAGLLALAIPLPALVGFLVVRRVATRLGTRRTIVACVLLLAASLGPLGLVEPDLPGGPHDARNLAIVCAALVGAGAALAGFLVLPNVIISQLIDLDEARTGANRSAMYFGAQGLLTKWVYAASAALLSFLFVKLGNSRAEPAGVLWVGPIASALLLASAGLYSLYPEEEVLRARPSADERLQS